MYIRELNIGNINVMMENGNTIMDIHGTKIILTKIDAILTS